jgi:archaellum biogenesis ATPase FlaH
MSTQTIEHLSAAQSALLHFRLGFEVEARSSERANLINLRNLQGQLREGHVINHWQECPEDVPVGTIPDSILLLRTEGDAAFSRLVVRMAQLGVPPMLTIKTDEGAYFSYFLATVDVFRLLDGAPLARTNPAVWKRGSRINLPVGALIHNAAGYDFELGELDADAAEGLIAHLTGQPEPEAAMETPNACEPIVLSSAEPAVEAKTDTIDLSDDSEAAEPEEVIVHEVDRSHPLSRYSLLGDSDRLEASLVEALPVLGTVALLGQLTLIFADSGVGKTLLTLHLLTLGIDGFDPAKVHYVNVDDNAAGLHEKLQIAEAHGFHMLAEGHRNFRASDLVKILSDLTDKGQVGGVIVILDTLTKFVDVIDKKAVRALMIEARRFVQAGGTFIALAHNNKNKPREGVPTYAGTADLVNDADCIWMLTEARMLADSDERAVKFTKRKSRHPMQPDQLGFAYAHGQQLAYPDLLASVRPVDAELLEVLSAGDGAVSDEVIIAGVKASIAEGVTTKMNLARKVSVEVGTSRRAVEMALARYAGDGPQTGHWTLTKGGPRGAFTYALHVPDAAPAAAEGGT